MEKHYGIYHTKTGRWTTDGSCRFIFSTTCYHVAQEQLKIVLLGANCNDYEIKQFATNSNNRDCNKVNGDNIMVKINDIFQSTQADLIQEGPEFQDFRFGPAIKRLVINLVRVLEKD